MQRITSTLISTLAAATAVVSIAPIASANPFVGNHDGWTYIQDSTNDGTGGNGIFEVFGMAYKQDGNTLSFAINSAMGIEGNYWGGAADKNVGYGDLMLNFGGTEYGVRFAGTNDSGVAEAGLYSDITTMDVTSTNSGWSTTAKYEKYVRKNMKGEARFFGDERDEAIFDSTAKRQSGNVLQSGTKVGDIAMLTSENLLNFDAAFGGAETGAETFGFSFEMTEEMSGEFIAKLWLECINDGLGMDGFITQMVVEDPVVPAEVPEPTGMLGLLGATVFGGSQLRRRRIAD
ncbi:MAG: XDD3 family exosortase-dependent surface protein [Cyanobacteria bacterium P01_C01_bin.89]